MLHYLWNLGRIAKCIWKPEFFTPEVEFLLEESLSIEELSDKGLTTWYITILEKIK
jgi:hypothetical protein